MCGVAGFVGRGDRGDLERMMVAIAHRGPDASGLHVDEKNGLHLGHQRLTILDPEDGAQPMWNEDHTVAVSFNGEIYNHAELRRELQTRGHRFSSDHSDTEVLVHGWEEWGRNLPLHLNGMFGFAIWDAGKQVVFLARDRFGEKPLYWARQKGTFFFASELTAIAAHSAFATSFDLLALKKYFAYGFVPSPNAIYQDAHKLSPGHWLQFDLTSDEINVQAWQQFRVDPMAAPPSLEEAAGEVRDLISKSVERRLMSDVPLGVFLSGGIDSSLAAATTCKFRAPQDVQTFSMGFREKSFDESGYARTVADALGTTHSESIFDFSTASDLIPNLLAALDEPLADASILPTYALCRFARSKVKVALSGDGGDELFGGYDTFAALYPANIYKAIVPNIAHKGMRKLAEFLPRSAANMSLDFKLRRFLQGLDQAPELWNPAWLAPLEPGDIENLFEEPIDREDLYSEALGLWRENPDKGIVDKTLEFYSCYYLPDNILTKVDRAAMLNGLEVRSIFLDNDLTDYVRRLPAKYKFDGFNRKTVLKNAARELVPQSILKRPKKGFGIPLKAWLADLSLTDTETEFLNMARHEVATRIRDHKTNQADHRLFLWSWTVLDYFVKTRHSQES
jgi:asparagine synthase (glutamine-hydrolysing)